jgi:tRNA U34 2-thiouridine synthase MnmA/TrmU
VQVAKNLGVPIKVFRVGDDYLDVIKNPRHGYGKNMNPCIDCRIYMHRTAGDFMREIGAEFIITGEVLGQRPMSQRRDALNIIDRESDLKKMVLRPLSAQVLPPTIPEEKGLVDREQLLRISGRGRKPQLELARQFEITDFACPAGGCLLTDPGFSRRMRDLLHHNPRAENQDIRLLKVGRHHRLPSGEKLIIGRNQSENKKLVNMNRTHDLLFQTVSFPGPTGLLCINDGEAASEAVQEIVSRIVLYYTNMRNNRFGVVRVTSSGTAEEIDIETEPATHDFIENIRL